MKSTPGLNPDDIFQCEMCNETKRMITGDCGTLLAAFYDGKIDQIKREYFLTIDRRKFEQPLTRS